MKKFKLIENKKVLNINLFGELEIWSNLKDYIDCLEPTTTIVDKNEIEYYLLNNL